LSVDYAITAAVFLAQGYPWVRVNKKELVYFAKIIKLTPKSGLSDSTQCAFQNPAAHTPFWGLDGEARRFSRKAFTSVVNGLRRLSC
ncbi:hypothetical protein, partial [Shewanella algae]